MIKARPVAGDIAAGDAFLKELQPYVWRKYMDYAAIADVHSIKRQIHAHKGHGEIAVQGPQCQARPRRHPRDRVLRPDPAAHRRRPLSRTARPRDRADAWPAGGARLDHRRGARRADPRNTGSCAASSTPSRWLPTSRRIRCRKTTRGWSASPACSGFADAAAFSAAFRAVAAAGRAPLCGAVRNRARAFGRHRQSGLHRRCRRSRHAADLARPRLPAAERHLPRHPQLAFRPLPRHPVGGGARAADRADAGAARRPSARRAAPTRR